MKFIVITHVPEGGQPRTPTVIEIEARNAEEAAGKADVSPGGYCFVAAVDQLRRFNRATIAPLEEVEPNGQPLPIAMPA